MTTKIDQIEWVMRGVRIYLEALEARLSDAQDNGTVDCFNPPDALIEKLREIESTLDDANDYLVSLGPVNEETDLPEDWKLFQQGLRQALRIDLERKKESNEE